MKQKVFTLLTLLLVGISSAWANQTELISGVTLPDVPSGTLDLSSQTTFSADANGWIVFNPQDYKNTNTYTWMSGMAWNSTSLSVQSSELENFTAPFTTMNSATVTTVRKTDRTKAIKFTGAESFSVLVNASNNNRYNAVSIYSYTAGNPATQSVVETKTGSTGSTNQELLFTGLNPSTVYVAYLYALLASGNDGNTTVGQVAIKKPVTDTTPPTFSLTTPATTSGVAITTRTIVLTASETVTKVGDNVAGTLKIGDAAASAINYTFDGGAKTLSYTFGEDLAYSTTYAFTVDASQVKDASNNQNDATSAFSFTTEADVPAELSSVSPNGGSVNGNSTVTVTAVGTVKYLWSENSTAEKSDPGWEDGASITVPNVAGTRYLHLYAYKRADNQTDITTKTFTITKVGSAVVSAWDFTKELSVADATIFDGATSWSPGSAADFTNIGLEMTAGLQYKGGNAESIVVYNNDANGSFILLNKGTPVIRIPSLNAGDVVTINTCKNGATDRSLTFTNATKTSGDVSASSPNDVVLSVTANGNVDLGISGGGMRLYTISVARTVPVVEVSVTAYGWATFNSDNALDLTNVDFAYKVTEADGENVTAVKVTEAVKANTPLLIKGTEGDAVTRVIPITTSSNDISATNKLIAVTADDTSITKAGTGLTNYILTVQSGVVVFAPIISTAATLNKGQAYLQLATTDDGDAHVLSIDFGEGSETTGVSEVSVKKPELRNEYYNLAGQRVAKPTKGLYIVNGKKVIVK